MPSNPVNDIRASGTLRTKTSSSAGPADDFESRVAIDPDGVLTQVGNAGQVRSRVYGDGSLWTPVQPATPGVLVPGQYFIETYLGQEWLTFVDALGVPQRLRPTPSSVSGSVVVPLGPAIVLDTVNVDAIRYAVYAYAAFNPTTGDQESGEIRIGHNGSPSADATLTQVNVSINLAFATSPISYLATLSGVGPAQTMSLEALASVGGWSVAFTRLAGI